MTEQEPPTSPERSADHVDPAPADWKNAGLLTVISGAVNILVSMIWICGLAGTGYGLVCCWVPFFPLTLAIAQIVVGIRMHNGRPYRHAFPLAIAGGVAGIMMFYGFFALILEIVAGTMLQKPETQAWLARALKAEDEARSLSGPG